MFSVAQLTPGTRGQGSAGARLALRRARASADDGLHRARGDVWHFLLPDRGMAGCDDKVVKSLEPAHFERMKKWRAKFNDPLTKDEVSALQRAHGAGRAAVAAARHRTARVRKLTSDELHVWPDPTPNRAPTTTKQKDAIWQREMLSEKVRNASPYRRLKLVMDYWCALWFWPVTNARRLPTREEWWFDLELLMHGKCRAAAERAQTISFRNRCRRCGIDFDVERDDTAT